MDEEIEITVIQKNATEELRIGLSEYRGHHLVNCRLWANYDSADEPKRPTKKGFALKVEKLPELIAALQEAGRRAVAEGWLRGAVTAAPETKLSDRSDSFELPGGQTPLDAG